MFYTQFINICKERGVKPTPVLKELGFSPGNLKKWSTGSVASAEVISALADYFNVSTDYFIRENNTLKMAMCAINAQYDHSISSVIRIIIYEDELECICKYTGLSRDELIDYEDIIVQTDKSSPNLNPLIILSDILSSLPGSIEFQCVQVRLSFRIIESLEGKGIGREELKGHSSQPGYNVGLRNSKIDALYDCYYKKGDNIRDVSGFTYSDLLNISKKCRVSLEYMYTGKDPAK